MRFTEPPINERTSGRYCANCEGIEICFIPETNTPLCYTCATVYAWGQNGLEVPQNRILESIDD